MRPEPRGPAPISAILALFALSGATSLVYEVLWLRELVLIFGSTQLATSTILATFMAGLALGAFVGGRWMNARALHPLAIYGWLEIGIGLYALAVPRLFSGLTPIFERLWSAGASESFLVLSLAKSAGIVLVLLPPTVLMGASLPVLARHVVEDPDRIGGGVGALYAVNTCGAILGVFLAGFVALPGLGMRATLGATALANLLLGSAAVALAARTRRSRWVSRPPRLSATRQQARLGARLVLFGFGASGFVALVLEVAWTRVLVLVMGSSVYAFALTLLAFLVGLACGSAFFSAWLRWRPSVRPAPLFAWLLAAAGLSAYGTAFAFGSLPRLVGEVFFTLAPGPTGWLVVQLALGLLIMFPATFALGGLFPLAIQLHARDLDRVSGSVGAVYAANTAGAIGGAMLAGFVLLPRLGVLGTVLAVVVVELLLAALVGLACVESATRVRALCGGALALVAAALTPVGGRLAALARPAWDVRFMNSGVYMNVFDVEGQRSWDTFAHMVTENNEVLYAAEGYTASVFVAEQPSFHNRYLSVNGKIEASTNSDLETQLMCAHLPLLLHERPQDVLIVGLASGITAGAAATHAVESIRVVEIEARMLPAARLFADANQRVLDDPRVTISINDARNELRFSDRTYDVIVSEPSNPWMTVASNLFTEEFFRAARTRLRPGGVFSQWIQTYYLPADDLRSIVAAFRSAFPQVLLFETSGGLDLVLLGSAQPVRLDLERLARESAELNVAMDLARVGMQDPVSILSMFRLGPAEIDRLVEHAGRNTDDNARVEFSAPRSLGRDTLPANRALLRSFRADPLAYVEPPILDPQRRDRLRLDLALALFDHGAVDLATEQAGRVTAPDLQEEAQRIRSWADEQQGDS